MRVRRAAVGLGNPGPRYARTRHNLGFLAVDRYLSRSRRRRESLPSRTSEVYRLGEFLLAKPQTYMNRSGLAVLEISRVYRLSPQE